MIWSLKVITIGILVWILTYIDWDLLFQTSAQANFSLLVVVLHLAIPNLFFSWLKWDYVVRFLDHTVRRRDTFSSVLSGVALDTVTISHFGDYAGRMINLARYPKLSLVLLQFFEKVYLTVISIFFGSLSLIIISLKMPETASGGTILFWIGVVLHLFSWISLVVSFRPHWTASLISGWTFLPVSFRAQLTETSRRIRIEDCVYLFIINHLKYFTFIIQFYLIVLAFQPISALDGFLGASATMVVRTILSGLTIGDLGIRELSSIYFFGQFGISLEVAFFSALLLFIINRLVPSLFGMGIILASEIKFEPVSRQFRFFRIPKKRHPARKTTQNGPRIPS